MALQVPIAMYDYTAALPDSEAPRCSLGYALHGVGYRTVAQMSPTTWCKPCLDKVSATQTFNNFFHPGFHLAKHYLLSHFELHCL